MNKIKRLWIACDEANADGIYALSLFVGTKPVLANGIYCEADDGECAIIGTMNNPYVGHGLDDWLPYPGKCEDITPPVAATERK
jgi:hypothetical protein